MQSIQKYLTFLVSVLFMCGVGGGYAALYVHIADERSKLAEARTELARMEQQELAEASLNTYIKRAKVDVEKLQTYILSIEDPLPFLNLIEEDMAKGAGVAVTVDSFVEESGGGTGAEEGAEIPRERYVRVTLSAVGAWEDLYHFLVMLERIPYVVRTEKVVFENKVKENVREWNVQVDMRMLAR
jgi:hypothetical protein